MSSYNKVILMGNLTRDPEIRNLANQQAVCEFGLAMNRKWKTPQGETREETTFVDCTAWGRQAEIINQHFHKGDAIHLDGRLKLDQWEDKQSGAKRSKLTVTVENFAFVGGPKQQDQGDNRTVGQQQSTPHVEDSDIPF